VANQKQMQARVVCDRTIGTARAILRRRRWTRFLELFDSAHWSAPPPGSGTIG
jgi:hypothetical protein